MKFYNELGSSSSLDPTFVGFPVRGMEYGGSSFRRNDSPWRVRYGDSGLRRNLNCIAFDY